MVDARHECSHTRKLRLLMLAGSWKLSRSVAGVRGQCGNGWLHPNRAIRNTVVIKLHPEFDSLLETEEERRGLWRSW